MAESVQAGGVAGLDRRPFEDFIVHEARLLDARRFRDWMALFADDGTYWVPAVPNQASPLDQASLFYDDRDLMKTRIDRLDHPRIHVQTPPSRTAHLVGNVVVEEADAAKGEYVVGSTLVMAESREDKQRERATASESCRSASISSIAIAFSTRWRCQSRLSASGRRRAGRQRSTRR